MKKETKAMLEMLLCASLWSIAGIFIKLIPWTGFAVASIRSLIASLTFAVYMLAKHYKLRLNKKTVIGGLITAMVYICFVCANKLTTSANAIVLQFTAPVFIVVLSALFLHTKILRSDLIVVLCTLAGIALCFLDELEGGHLAGNCIAVAAGLFMAGMYIVVGTQAGEERFSTIFLGQFFTFLIGLPNVIATKPEFSTAPVVCILILGVLQLGIPYILYVKSSEYCPPLACSLLGAVEPLLNPVWVMIFDGETPGVLALIGGIVVIASVTLWCVYKNRKETAESAA